METNSLADFLAAIRRRKGLVALTASLVFLAAALIAVLWPPTYQSTATILMEEPAVPRDLVRSTIASYADQRVQVITQRVMATRNLVGIIEKHELYPDDRAKEPISVVVGDMRDDIKFRLVSADVVDPRSGRPTQANIAFTLSFDYRNPEISQRVLSEIVSLYLSENVRTRQEKVAETADFLTQEATKLEERVTDLEAKLAVFKQKFAGSLPEDARVNLQRMDRFQRALQETTSKILLLEERKIFLKSELAQVDPQLKFRGGSVELAPPKEKLRMLQSQIISLRARYGSAHPDVMRLKREIDALEEEVGSVEGNSELIEELELAREERATLLKKYSDLHPDVKKVQRKIASLENALAKSREQNARKAVEDKDAVNPIYIQLRAQLASIDLELKSLSKQRDQIRKKVEVLDDSMARSPEVERNYRILQRDYENAQAEYQDVKAKLTEAELGRSLEAASKSERLSLIEPPLLPSDPVSPNRIAILLLGFVFSIGSSVGLASLLETMSEKIYGARQLAAITGAPPLAIIPEIVTKSDQWRRRGKRVAIISLALAVLVGSVTALHFYFMPLDVLWFKIERRLDLGSLF